MTNPSAPQASANPPEHGGGGLSLGDPRRAMALVKHRYPFLLVDRVLEADANRIVARKCVSFNEPYFQGHFPGDPIMPGVLILEGMGQAGCAMVGLRDGDAKRVYSTGIDKARFKKPVVPGDVLTYECESPGASANRSRGKFLCRALVDGEVVASATALWVASESAPEPKAAAGRNLGAPVSSESLGEDVSTEGAEAVDVPSLLKHRYPFLLVDRVLGFHKTGVVARKCVTFNEEYFIGHFPGEPVMPGCLILEGMAQAGCLYIGRRDGGARTIFLAGVERARFRRPVYPGDVLNYRTDLTMDRKRFGRVSCRATVAGGELVAEAEMTFAYGD